jgi:hypothetical protein
MKLFIAPQKIKKFNRPAIFLAGSIEMGRAVEWQDQVIEKLKDLEVTIFNPRRERWRSDWKQSIKNKKFKEQVSWELDALEKSDLIIMFFDPASKSPISLLELGLFARDNKILCCCPPKFWRHGNVEFICQKFKIPLYSSLDSLMDRVKTKLFGRQAGK